MELQRRAAGWCMCTVAMAMLVAALLSACGGGGGGSSASASSANDADSAPIAQIGSTTPSNPTTESEITFEAGSPNSLNSYAWRFGDGGTASGQRVSHRYSTPGSYAVTLIVVNEKRLQSVANMTVAVTAIPVSATIGAITIPKPRVHETIKFTGTGTGQPPLNFEWKDNGAIVSRIGNAPFSYTFFTAGQHTITLTVTDATGKSASSSATVSVSAALPTAEITGAPSRSTVGDTVFFQAQTDTAIVHYHWDFGDGTPVVAGESVQHRYDTVGAFKVTLRTTNASGDVATATRTVDVHYPPPSVRIETRFPGTPVLASGQTQVFSARAEGAHPMQYQWRFSDGSSASTANAQHIFREAGLYEVHLEVADSHGERASAHLSVKVGAARFEFMPGTNRSPRLQAGQGTQSLSQSRAVPLLCQGDGSVLFLDGAVYRLDAQRRVTPFAGLIRSAVHDLEARHFNDVRFFGNPAFIVRNPDGVPYVQDYESLWRLEGATASRVPLNFREMRMDAVDRQGRVWYREPLVSASLGGIWRYDPATGKQEKMATSPVGLEGDPGPAIPYFDGVRHMVFSPKGDLYFIEQYAGVSAIRRMTSDGRMQAVGTVAGSLMSSYNWSSILDVDDSGTAFLLDQGPRLHVLRDGTHRVIPIGSNALGAQMSACPHPSGKSRQVALSLDEGDFMVDIDQGTLTKWRGRASDFANPTGRFQLIGADAAGQLYAVKASAVGKVDSLGRFVAWVGSASSPGSSDGPGGEARFDNIYAGAVTPNGEVWVVDTLGQRLRHVDAKGAVTSFPTGDEVQVLTADASGNAILVGRQWVQRVRADGTRTQGPVPGGYRIENAVVNKAGTLYFKYGCAIYQQPANGPVSLLVGVDGGSFGDCRLGLGYPPTDGEGAKAYFNTVSAMAVDAAGTLYIADHQSLRRISPAGKMETLASMYLRLPDENGDDVIEADLSPSVLVVLPSGEVIIQTWELLARSSGLGISARP